MSTYISDHRWMPRETYYDIMQDCKAIEFLDLDNSARFLVEVAYLNFWNTEHDNAPDQEGIDIKIEFDYENTEIIVTISCDKRINIEPLSLIYDIGSRNRYGLMIMDGDNIVYRRDPNQDEATEWLQNCMANDPLITDEYGNWLFIGEPVQE